MNRVRHPDQWILTVRALETTQPVTIAHRPDRQVQLRAVLFNRQMSGRHSVKPTNRPEPSRSGTNSGIKRDARAAELPVVQGGKFQQVEGLTTVDAAEIPCEFSVEDDFVIDENAEAVDEEMVKAVLAGKKMGRIAEGFEGDLNEMGKRSERATSGDADS